MKKRMALFLGLLMLLGSVNWSALATSDNPETMIYGLQTEYRTNPIGIDEATPQFSWKMQSTKRGKKQAAYQVLVAESKSNLEKENLIWDSGKQTSDQSVGITYGGDSLKASTRYFWKVKVWDEEDAVFTSSEEAYFETGLMDSGWSDAQWIGKGTQPIVTEKPESVSYTSFSIDIDFKIVHNSFGLIFGAKDTNNFYMWQVNATNKTVVPHKWTDGNAATVGGSYDISQLEKTVTEGQYSHLQVKVTEGKIDSYINGTFVGSYTTDAFDIGKVGFRTCGDDFYVDNLLVKDGNGNIILHDDFSDPTNPTIDGSWQEYQLYYFGLIQESRYLQKIDFKKITSTFTIDVDANVAYSAVGIIFGAQDTNNFYMWQVNLAENAIVPHQWSNGIAATIPGAKQDISSANLSLNQDFHLQLKVTDGKVESYINGALVGTCTVSPFDLGKVGFRVCGEEAYVDNFVLKDAKGKTLLADDFSKPSNPNFDGGSCENGKLHLNGMLADTVVLQKEPSAFACSTFTVDVDYIIDKDAFGLIFGASDTQNFYMWQVNASTDTVKLRPHQWIKGNASLVDEISLSNVYQTKQDAIGKKSHMTVSVNNGEIKTYINDELVDTRQVAEFDFGGIGLRASSESFRVDNIVVKDESGNIIHKYDFDEGVRCDCNGGTITDGMLSVTTGPIYAKDSGLVEAAPMLRKEFSLSGNIKSARLYATAAGIYEMYINGAKVGDSYLNPGSTQYNETILYQTYDVTDMVKQGDNAIAGMLGHGWYNGAYRYFGANVALLAKLLVTYDDGSTDIIVTDGNWHYSANGPIFSNDYFMGEEYDATREQDGWDQAKFDDSDWLMAGVYTKSSLGIGDIIAQDYEPIKNNITLSPIEVTEPEDGVFIYDFGQNMAGIPRIKITGDKGTTIRVRYGEMLNLKDMVNGDGEEGTLYTENLHAALNTDYYTLKGDPNGETFEPSFVYRGFRYMEITGIDQAIPLDDIQGLVFYSALEETGTFESSNELVNKLYQNTLWSQRDNFMSIPTDCPQRNERWGWTGDAHVFARTASYNMNTYAFFRKYTRDMRDTQTSDGKYPDVSPGHIPTGWTFQNGNATSGWGDAGVIIPWQMYLQYGDKAIIEENYEAMCKWIDHLVQSSDNYIRAKGWTGDWLSIDEKTPFGVTDTAFCAYSSDLLSKMAQLIGKTEDAQHYSEIYNNFKAAWNREYVNSDGSTKCGTQTSYVLGLQFNLFADDVRENAAAYLVKNIKDRGYKLTTGFLGLSYLNPVLTKMGYADVAYRLLEQVETPSWLYSVTTGATTIWEAWDSLVINEDGSSMVNSTSFNHYSHGAVCEWLYTDVAGIDRDESNPGFKHIVLKPSVGGSLTYAKASYDSVYGKINSGWTLEGNKLTYKATVPANTTATLYLPIAADGVVYEGNVLAEQSEGVTFVSSSGGQNVYELVSGDYTFTLNVDSDDATEELTVPSIADNLMIDMDTVYDPNGWGNNGDPYMNLTSAIGGGLKFSWNLNAKSLRDGLMKTFDLNGLQLKFSNFNNSKADGGNFAIILSDVVDNQAFDCQQLLSATASIVLEIDTTDGVIRFANSGHNGSLNGFVADGDVILSSDLLKYSNIQGKPFSISFTSGDDGSYNVILNVNGFECVAENALTKSMLSTLSNLNSLKYLFVAISDFGDSDGVSVEYKSVGPARVTTATEGLTVPATNNMGAGDWWPDTGWLKRRELTTGGMNFRFKDAFLDVRQSVGKLFNLEDLRLEFDNLLPINFDVKSPIVAFVFSNTATDILTYDGMLSFIVDTEYGKIAQISQKNFSDYKCLVEDARIKQLVGRPFAIEVRKAGENYKVYVQTDDFTIVSPIDISMATAFDAQKPAYVGITPASLVQDQNFEVDWLGIGNVAPLAHVHDLKKVAAKDPSCTEAGNREYYKCSECNKLFADANGTTELTEEEVKIQASGHSPSAEWKNDGTNHWHECANCGLVIDDSKSSHDYDNDEDTTCNTCGYVRTITPAAHTHTYGTEWEKDKDCHWHECTDENCADTANSVKDKQAHTYGEWTETKAPTEKEAGEKEHTCTVCGYKETAEIPVTVVSKPDDSEPIQTGDNSQMVLWIALLFVGGVGVGGTILYRKRKNRR